MVLFFNMLDVAGVAPFIIWISLNKDWSFNDRQRRCRKFLKQLGQELTNDYIQVSFKPKLSEVKCEKCPENDWKARLSSPTSTSNRKPVLEMLQAVPNTDRQENTRSMQYLQWDRVSCPFLLNVHMC